MLLSWLMLVLLASRPKKGLAVEELANTAATDTQRRAADAASEDDKEASFFANRRVD